MDHQNNKLLKFCGFLLVMLTSSSFALENLRPKIELKTYSQGIVVTLDFTHIQARQWLDLLADPQRFHEAGYGLVGQAGAPALPLITELIPVSTMDNPVCSILSEGNYQVSSILLKETPPAHYEADSPLSISNYDWSTQRSEPTFSVKLGSPVKMLGQTYLPLTINPLKLNRGQQKIRIPEKLSIQISGVTGGAFDLVGETGSIRSVIPDNDIHERLGHYLIITPPTFEPHLQTLVTWKKRKGHPVTVVSTNEAGQTPTDIKAFIQSAYDTWEDPPRYVLLIGDEDRGIGGFYVYNPENEALVTDHPYVLLDGDDSFPEAWIGRLSVDTYSELITVINKILHYERQPYLNDPGWFKRALMICTITAAASTQHTDNWVSRKLMDNGFTQVDTAYYPMQSSLSYISNPINNGLGFVNYRGLGAWDHWIGPYYYNSDIDLLHNGFKLPIVTSIVCGGGNYASFVDPVFGEKWIRAGTPNVPKGAVAFIGPSEVHTHTQFNNVINIALYSAIFDLDLHELGPALWHAKLELWRNYYQSEYMPYGQSAEYYQNIYNILGDPGMAVWTDTPQVIVVEYPPVLNQSDDHVTVSVQNEDGLAIPEAYVFLLNAENAVGSRTDAAGLVNLPFTPGAETSLTLTVTGADLNPVLEDIPISTAEYPVSCSNWGISPDGLLEAGESQGLNLTLVNNTDLISELTLTLSSSEENCVISDSVVVLEAFESGASVDLPDIFNIVISADARHGETVHLVLDVATPTESWSWQHSYPIQAPELSIVDVEIMSGELIAGDSVVFRLIVENAGGKPCLPNNLTLLEHPLAWSASSVLNCPAIGIDEVMTTENETLLILSDQIFPGENLYLGFVSDLTGRHDTLYTTITIEQLNRFTPSLPDAYGYRVFDDMDISYSMVPEYDWLEIDPDLGGTGVRLPISDEYEEDDETAQVELPFPVSYYGQTYGIMTICSNGWVALGSSPEVSFYNRVIPSASGPNAMIAPFWDDLITEPGGVSFSSTDDQIIIEWSRLRNMQINSDLNFQVIIYSTDSYPTSTGDNLIKMQFKDYHNWDTFANFSTTGIESPDYTTGLQVSYNNITETSVGILHAGQALLFTTERGLRYPPPEISLSQFSLDFILNPWSQASDSIAITNSGGSTLIYSVEPLDEPDREPVPNPLAGIEVYKGGSEPPGDEYTQTIRDLYDYIWHDQDDQDGPLFVWQNISQPANEVAYPGDPDDTSIGPFEIGFEFPFYSRMYSEFYFSSNGTISFESTEHPWNNLPLPNGAAPAALIAPWWDDLNNDDGIQGVPYFWSNGVDTAIVTWDNFPKFGTSDFHTFQLILVVNGDIIFQYLEMEGARTVSTVGIQNSWKNDGILIYYNIPNDIDEGDAIRISRRSNWLIVNNWSGMIGPGETGHFPVNIDTRNLEPGLFSVPLLLSSNAGNQSEMEININLEVINGTPPSGDVNGDYQVNIIDLTELIDYVVFIEDPDADQFTRADLNSDGHLDIFDALALVEIINVDSSR
ncbi:MAG: C25 family cysteine peptidase [Candidatus Marinimicrobia bacterium]|nr:C25 family cysteine peptidase [Candidatus Neomarinimicrobiota bacterium]